MLVDAHSVLRLRVVAFLSLAALIAGSLASPAAAATSGSDPRDLTAVGNTLYFTAQGGGGRELWRSNGTEAGTVRVKDIRPGPTGSSPEDLVDVAGTLYFVADNGSGRAIWKSDGSSAGTVLVVQHPTAYLYGLHAFIGRLFFVSSTDAGHELWKTDGSPGGEQLVAPIAAGYQYIDLIENAGDGLYLMRSGDTDDGQLWKTSGFLGGTRLLKTLSKSAFAPMTGVGNRLFFLKAVGSTGHFPTPATVWRSNGTPEGTRHIKDLVPGDWDYAFNVIDAGGTAFFHTPGAIWRSNGSRAGTQIVATDFGAASPSYQHQPTYVDGVVFFTVVSNGQGYLWKSDLTSSGTEQVSDAEPFRCLTQPFQGCPGRQSANSVGLGGALLYSSHGPGAGVELWRSDGTGTGTHQVIDILPGWKSANPGELTPLGGFLYFTVNDGTHGRELWRSNGTDNGTWMVRNL